MYVFNTKFCNLNPVQLSWFESRDYCLTLNKKLVSLENVARDRDLMRAVYENESGKCNVKRCEELRYIVQQLH